MKSALLLVKILNQASSTLLHLGQAALEAEPVGNLLLMDHSGGGFRIVRAAVLWVPNVVRYEFFKSYLPMIKDGIFIDISNRGHKSFNILNQYIIPCDQYLLLWTLCLIVRDLVFLTGVLPFQILSAHLVTSGTFTTNVSGRPGVLWGVATELVAGSQVGIVKLGRGSLTQRVLGVRSVVRNNGTDCVVNLLTLIQWDDLFLTCCHCGSNCCPLGLHRLIQTPTY